MSVNSLKKQSFGDNGKNIFPPRLIAWEITRSCNLTCVHCRASAETGTYKGELGTDRCMEILKEISDVAKPIIILTGGEPLLRKDVFDLASRGTELGLKMAMATNGTLLTDDIVKRMIKCGIQRVSVSIDAPDSARHDTFRNVPGCFDKTIDGIKCLKSGGIEFQINTTVTRHNSEAIQEMLDLAINLGAVAHHLFLLVPTGRAKELVNQEIEAKEYEKLLYWFYSMRGRVPLHLKATCAPHYYRILREEAHKKGEYVSRETYGMDAVTRGCLGGTAFCFIGYNGAVQPCGYLDISCGNLAEDGFENIWNNSSVFNDLRDYSKYEGKCGQCEYIRVCGGCRARAYESTKNYLSQEPLCSYVPNRVQRENING